METIQPFGSGSRAVEVDVLGPNPLVAYVRAAYGGSPYGGEAPTFFASGDRPPYLASGQSPDLLRRVRYELRHSAAQTESGSLLYKLIEASADLSSFDPERLVTPEGRDAFASYRERVWRWAIAGPPVQDNSYSADDLDRLFRRQTA